MDRISEHVELSLTEVLGRADLEIGRAEEEIRKQVVGAEGRRAQAESRHSEVLEVWPESHWPGFALRKADVFQSDMA